MTAEDEHTVELGSGNSDVLSSSWWEIFSLGFFFLPAAFLYYNGLIRRFLKIKRAKRFDPFELYEPDVGGV